MPLKTWIKGFQKAVARPLCGVVRPSMALQIHLICNEVECKYIFLLTVISTYGALLLVCVSPEVDSRRCGLADLW